MLRLVLALASGPAFALAGWLCLPRAVEAARLLAAADDPAAISELALDRTFDARLAEREIEAALAAGDADLAQSFVDLARDRAVAVTPELVQRVAAEVERSQSASAMAASFARGLIVGDPDDAAGLAGAVAGDLFVLGDIRDVIREAGRYLRGQEPDRLMLGLAGAGLAVSAGTYVSMGAGAPARAGLSLIKSAHKTARKGAARLARHAGGTAGMVRLAGDLGRVQAKAGTRAAFDAVGLVRHPREMTRVAVLAEKKGSRTRAILKTLGRGALFLSVATFNLASWILSAFLSLLGFAASAKGAVERMTRRSIDRRKARLRLASASLDG